MILNVYVPTGCGGWTWWCLLKVTFAYDSSLLNTGDTFFNFWKQMGLFLCVKYFNVPPENQIYANIFMLIPVLNGNKSPFEYCRAILEDDGCTDGDGQLSVTFQTLLNKKTFFWHIDWHWFLLKFTHMDGHRQRHAIVSFSQVAPCKKMTLLPCQWPDVERMYCLKVTDYGHIDCVVTCGV